VDGWSHLQCKFLHTSDGASETESLQLSCFIGVFDVIMLLFVQSIPDYVGVLGLGQSVLLLDFKFIVHCLVFGSHNLCELKAKSGYPLSKKYYCQASSCFLLNSDVLMTALSSQDTLASW
jgi:hypothetical protein